MQNRKSLAGRSWSWVSLVQLGLGRDLASFYLTKYLKPLNLKPLKHTFIRTFFVKIYLFYRSSKYFFLTHPADTTPTNFFVVSLQIVWNIVLVPIGIYKKRCDHTNFHVDTCVITPQRTSFSSRGVVVWCNRF